MIDVDNFKQINDEYGHNSGDEVLKEVAEIIQKEAKNNIVIRFGGDEFLIVVANHSLSTHDEDARNKKVNKIISSIENTASKMLFSENKLPVHLSLGSSNSINYSSLLEVLDKADKEMYKMKFERKNGNV